MDAWLHPDSPGDALQLPRADLPSGNLTTMLCCHLCGFSKRWMIWRHLKMDR